MLFAETEKGIFDAILEGHVDFSSDPWPHISSQAKDLIRKMLTQNPKERLTPRAILSECVTPVIIHSNGCASNVVLIEYVLLVPISPRSPLDSN